MMSNFVKRCYINVGCLQLQNIQFNKFSGKELSSAAFKKNALHSSHVKHKPVPSTKIPNLLELTSFVFFVGGYFVGPQFSMNHYRNAINHQIHGPNRYLFSGIRFIFNQSDLNLINQNV